MSLSIARRETTFDPKAPLTGKETQQDAERMEFQALSLEASGKPFECLQLMEKALQILCQVCNSGESTPVSIAEACDAAERLVTKSNAYGIKAFKDDNYETASTLFGYALEMTGEDSYPLREADDRRRYLRGVTLNNYGCMERRRGHFPGALAYMQRSMECTGEQSPVAFLNMSAIQTQLRLCEDAAGSAMRAIQNLGSSPEDPSLLAVAHHNLAMALEPSDPARALEEYQEALNLARSIIGNESNTTLIIERNMTRFLGGHQRSKSLRGGDLLATRTATGSIISARGSLHLGENKPTDTTYSNSPRQPRPPCEDEEIFPHPFMNSAADSVIPRKVIVTRMYHPSISTHKTWLPPRRSPPRRPPPKRSKPAAVNTTAPHMYTQIPRDRHEGVTAQKNPPRTAPASRLPPIGSHIRHGSPPTVPTPPMTTRTTNITQPTSGVQKSPRTGAAAQEGVKKIPERNLARVPQPSSTHVATTKSHTGRTPSNEVQAGRDAFIATAPTSGTSRLTPVGRSNLSHGKSSAVLGGTHAGSTGLANTVPGQSKPSHSPMRSTEPLKPSRANLAAAASVPLAPAATASSTSKNVNSAQAPVRSTEPMKSTADRATVSSGRLKPVTTAGGTTDYSKSPVSTVPATGGTRFAVTSNAQVKAPLTLSTIPTALRSDSPKKGGANQSGRSMSVEQVPEEGTSASMLRGQRQLKASRGLPQGMNLVSYISDRLDMLMVDEEELDRKQMSASIIQRAFRSYLARKLLAEMRENRATYNLLSEIREKIAVRKLQLWFRKTRRAGRNSYLSKRVPEALASERYKSAIHIQTAARGWLARRLYARRKFFENNSGHAAVAVQSWWRQILAKRKLATLKRHHEVAKAIAVEKERRDVAATVIQSRWRTRKAELLTRTERMRAREIRRKKAAALRWSAACTIQTWWRLLTARAVLHRLREAQAAREARLMEHQRKVDAATKLQSFGRMIITKNEVEPLLTGFRINVARRIRETCAANLAASKIQRAFRSYYAKRLLRRLRRERREKKLRLRRCALLTVAQRVGRGFLTRRDLGQLLQKLENEAREFSQRKLALEAADHTRKPIPITEQQKPNVFREECRSATMTEERRTHPFKVPRAPVGDKQYPPESLHREELGLHNMDAEDKAQLETLRTLQQEVDDEEQRLTALAAAVSADEDADERQKLHSLDVEGERLNTLYEHERISALAAKVPAWEQEDQEVQGLMDHGSMKHQDGDAEDQTQLETLRTLQQEVDDEEQRLSALAAAVSADAEEEEVGKLGTPRQVHDEGEQKLSVDQQLDGVPYSENHVSAEENTEDIPTQYLSTLTPSEAQQSRSLEALLKIEREKRRFQMESEKRLRQSHDTLAAQANDYRLRKIATAESSQELKMLIPRQPLGRRRLQKKNGMEMIGSAEFSSSSPANVREQQEQERHTLDVIRMKENAALDITRLARGYLDRKFTRALKMVLSDYIELRVDMDSEEPPLFDNTLLQKFTNMYQGKVEETRAVRLLTLIQTFMRAACSRITVSARAPSYWSSGKVYSVPQSRRYEAARCLSGFARIIQAKKELAALKKELAVRLHETQDLRVIAILRGFLYMIHAKKELAARRRAVRNHLEQEDALYVQSCAANRIACFFRAAVATSEVRRRQGAIKQKLLDANASEKIVSFLWQCCAKKELARRRALVEQQRNTDIELETILDLAAMRVQRAYRSYKARQLAQEQREAKEQRWSSIQAQDEEITAAMVAIAADAPNEAELWARFGYSADGVDSEGGSGNDNENERDVEVEALVYCVVQVQRVVRSWLARRYVQKLRLELQQGWRERERQEDAVFTGTGKDGGAEL